MTSGPVRFEIDVRSGTSQYVPLTADEVKQRAVDDQAAAVIAAGVAAAQAERDALAAKLAANTASPNEVQQALAQLLG